MACRATPFALAMALCVAGALMGAPAGAQSAAQGDTDNGSTLVPHDRAVLRMLDKITARVRTVEVAIDQTYGFGSLRITPRTCRKAPPEETPEAAVFLEIDDTPLDGSGRQRVFSGWMFQSSPALSALEHPIYDVWLIDCKNLETSSESSPE